jgi:hypothetical protein
MSKIILILALTILLSPSCDSHRKSQNTNSTDIRISIREVLKQDSSALNISTIARSIEYIPLETTENSMLLGIHDVQILENNIFVSDQYTLYQFENSGKLIKQIGAKGNAPGEYSGRICFTLNPLKNEIYIQDRGKINVYDLNSGSFKRAYESANKVYDIYSQQDGSLLSLTYEFPSGLEGLNEITLTDGINGRLLDSIANYSRETIRGNAYGYPLSYKKDDNVFYIFNFSDTLYRISKDFFREIYLTFNMENTMLRKEINLSNESNDIQFPDFLSISSIIENQDYIFITIRHGISLFGGENKYSNVLYNKSSGTSLPIKGIINDIDAGLGIWPQFIQGNMLIGFISSQELIEHPDNKLKLHEEDNPVLVLLHPNN